MSTKDKQQPLLYIQQPKFEKLTAPMQQYFISKKQNNEQKEVQQLAVVNKIEVEKQEEIIITLPEPNSLIKEVNNTETVQDHETDESKVMEFILEGILSPREDEDLIGYVSKGTTPIGEPNTTIELKRKKRVSSEEVETIKEDTEQSPSESNSNEKINEKKKKKKRTPFNGLSLVDKLNELRKMPNNFAKVLYEFVTREKTYSGYFLSFKNDGILIQPKSSKQTIKIPEHQIINIKIIGF